jgi:hypothetical protein
MMLTKKRLENLGGIGSIAAGLMCSGICWMDYTNGQAWKIWVIMTVVLVVNGIAMIRHAAKRVEDETSGEPAHRVVKVRA